MLSVLREARHTRKAGENAEKVQRIDEKGGRGDSQQHRAGAALRNVRLILPWPVSGLIGGGMPAASPSHAGLAQWR